MSHWYDPMPDYPAPDPLGKKDQTPHPAGWKRCRQCGRWTAYRGGAKGETCTALECNLAEDRAERERSMTTIELDAYRRAAEAYFNRPEAPAGTPRPLKAPVGLSRLSAREKERQSLKRAQDELDEREAKERGL
jgi:hypothetical protein